MGEAVLRPMPGSAVQSARAGADANGLGLAPRRLAPRGRRHFDHAAEQPLLRAAAQQHRAVRRGSARTRRRGAAAAPAFRPAPASPRRCRAARAAQSSRHGHSTQRGRRGVQIVAPRSIIAWAKSPARCAGTSAAASARRRGLAAGSGSRTAKSRATTRSTLPSTAAVAPVEGDRRDRRRGVVADPGQRAQRRDVVAERRPPCRSTTARAQACRLRARA